MSNFRDGDIVTKTKGIPFGGVPCKNCGHTEFAVINGSVDNGRRVTAKHPEGWSHIFDPDQLEFAARFEAPVIVELLREAQNALHDVAMPDGLDQDEALRVAAKIDAALKGQVNG